MKCITKSSGFGTVCLEKPVLHASLSALNHLCGDSMEYLENSLYRFAGYKQYTFLMYNYLWKGLRKVIPSSTVWEIRNEYKPDNDVYVPFMRVEKMKSAIWLLMTKMFFYWIKLKRLAIQV